jgi:asparagine synthase (glutamine-hydrolysing)
MLCKVLGVPARTYSIGFDASGYDEMAYARIAARHFGTDHHEYYVTPDDLLEGIPAVAAHFDQPFGNSSAVPAWICARHAHDDGIELLLAGDGGDELFGGNSRYARQRIFGWYDAIPAAVCRHLIEPALSVPAIGRLPLIRKGASYVEQARVPLPDRTEMYNLLLRLGPENVFVPAFLAAVDPRHPTRMQRETWQDIRAGALINRMLAFDWKYTLADNDLPKVVGATGLAGVDVGFPLLADALVDFSLRLPPEWKLKGLTLRWFFKEALKDFLPPEIIAKKKHGFGLPFGVWAATHPGLRQMSVRALESFGARGIIREDFLHHLVSDLLPAHPGYYGEMVWIVMMLEHWLAAHATAMKAGG